MHKSIAMAGMTALWAVGLGACAIQTPEIEPRDVSLENLTLSGLELMVELDLTNPNDFALPLTQMDWSLDLSGSPLADGVARVRGEEVPALGRARVDVPVKVSFGRVADTALTVLQKRRINYRIYGDLGFDTPLGMLAFPFEDEGRWSNPLLSQRAPQPTARVKSVVPELRTLEPGDTMPMGDAGRVSDKQSRRIEE